MIDKRGKKIKFALYLKDGNEVRTRSDLKKYFSMKEIIGYLLDGKLSRWMKDHDYPVEAWQKVEELLKAYHTEAKLFKKGAEDEKRFTKKVTSKLCRIFDIDPSTVEEVTSIEQIKEANEKEAAIKKVAAFEDEDEEERILNYVNQIVRNQTELDEVIRRLIQQKKFKIPIYLLNNPQNEAYVLRREDVFGTPLRFVGINLEENEDDEP